MNDGNGHRTELELVARGRLIPAVSGDVLLSASITPGNALLALWTAESDVDAIAGRVTDPGGASFPTTRPSRPVATRVTLHDPETRLLTEFAALPMAHPSVHSMPDGQLLVVGARAEWRPEGADRNAVLYDAEGRVLAEETLGDGIQQVVTTRGGRIWVGYTDEGVYGNFGWGFDGPEPLGASGLVRYDAALRRDWEFPAINAGLDTIDDCYALNLDGETAWVCYYSDFSVVRIRDGVVKAWTNEVHSAAALAVAGDTVAFAGGYAPDRHRLVLARLGGDSVHVTGEYRLTLPGGKPLPARSTLFGQGSVVHVLTEDAWYTLDITRSPLR
ncbi:hypothetical protein [Amycolatopsis sp. NPDC051071]|uniref:hypothetical protein n=1 Tax=Amycolatopsis sp. NPDC051071 TaxID=3154637 RepID=UPI00344664FF